MNKENSKIKILSQKAFTLVEVLVSILIVGIIVAGNFTVVSVLVRSEETARQRSTAINLMQKSQEEVRRVAQTFYDELDTCQFPAPGAGPSPVCGFEDIVNTFPGFIRKLTVGPEGSSNELKRIYILVQWSKMPGGRQDIESLVLLARPPDATNGSLKGQVSSSLDPNTPLGGVTIQASHQTSTFQSSTLSSSTFEPQTNINYNFKDFVSGQFPLPVGTYSVIASHPGFLNFPENGQELVIINSAEETTFNILLDPKPVDATLNVRAIDQLTGNPVSIFNAALINAYENGTLLFSVGGQTSAVFTIPFTDTEEQCFTVNSHNSFKAAYAGFPGCQFAYNKEGYSTAITSAAGSMTCGNPYNGNTASDRVCVSPGDIEDVDLMVVPVPEATITGRVIIKGTTTPIANAEITADWPKFDGNFPPWKKNGITQTAFTDSDGKFTFNVPAVQEMYPITDPDNNYLRVTAKGMVQVIQCCDAVQNVERSFAKVVGPLNLGVTVNTGDYPINGDDSVCGDVNGQIKNDQTGSLVSGVDVKVSVTATTNGVGEYSINCTLPQTGFRLNASNYSLQASKTGFYTNDTKGNNQYTQKGSNGNDVHILPSQAIIYNARLWPQGTGTINVTVTDFATGSFLSGIDVELTPYFGASSILQTDTSGKAIFLNALETWPPPSLPTDGYYKTTPLNHTVDVNPNPAVYIPQSVQVSNFHAGNTLNIDIQLKKVGGI